MIKVMPFDTRASLKPILFFEELDKRNETGVIKYGKIRGIVAKPLAMLVKAYPSTLKKLRGQTVYTVRISAHDPAEQRH